MKYLSTAIHTLGIWTVLILSVFHPVPLSVWLAVGFLAVVNAFANWSAHAIARAAAEREKQAVQPQRATAADVR